MNTKHLNEAFPDAPGYRNKSWAEKKLRDNAGMWEGQPVLTCVVERVSDGRFLPILIIGRDARVNLHAVATNNICVTNVT